MKIKSTIATLLSMLVVSVFSFSINNPTPAQAQTAPRIVAIGDSVTDDFGNGSWRGPLASKLSALGQPFAYVGTRTDVAGNHEAYGGATSCDFFTDRASSFAQTYNKPPTWDIRVALGATSPTVAIIDIGINNYAEDLLMKQGAPATGACGLNPGSLQRLWDAVVYYPGITGVIITTVEDSAIPDGTENINAIARKYVADRQAQGSNVCLGEVPASFAGLTVDRFHLSALGKDAVADALLGPVRTAIAGTCATPPPPAKGLLFNFSAAGAISYTSADAAQNPPPWRSATSGLQFTMLATRTATAIRFYKGTGDTAKSRTVGIYSSTGALLVSATSSGEPDSGWVSVPIKATQLTANASYVAAVFSPTGAVAYQRFFHVAAIYSSLAVAPANAGQYVYGNKMAFPNNAYLATGNFIDVEVQ